MNSLNIDEKKHIHTVALMLVNIPITKWRYSSINYRSGINSTRISFSQHWKKTDINACFYNLSGPPDHMTRHFFSHRTTAAVCTVYPDIITLNVNQFSCLSINRSCSIESSGLSLSAMMTNMPRIWVPRVFYNIQSYYSWNVWFLLYTQKYINFFFIYTSPNCPGNDILKSTLKFLTHIHRI